MSNVNHPKHYNEHPSGIECIVIVEGFNFNVGNAIKYLWRAGLKSENPIEDLEKAVWYCQRELERVKKAHLTPLALDGGDSAALQALSTPEVLSTLQGDSNPAYRK